MEYFIYTHKKILSTCLNYGSRPHCPSPSPHQQTRCLCIALDLDDSKDQGSTPRKDLHPQLACGMTETEEPASHLDLPNLHSSNLMEASLIKSSQIWGFKKYSCKFGICQFPEWGVGQGVRMELWDQCATQHPFTIH